MMTNALFDLPFLQHCNDSPAYVEILDFNSASIYPYKICCTDYRPITASLGGISMSISNFTHSQSLDVSILLTKTLGLTTYYGLMFSQVGLNEVVNANIKLYNSASSDIPYGIPLTSGEYRPYDYSGGAIPFYLPKPLVDKNTGEVTASFNEFMGINPYGCWKVWIIDSVGGDSGSIGNISLWINGTEYHGVPPEVNPWPTLAWTDTYTSFAGNTTGSFEPSLATSSQWTASLLVPDYWGNSDHGIIQNISLTDTYMTSAINSNLHIVVTKTGSASDMNRIQGSVEIYTSLYGWFFSKQYISTGSGTWTDDIPFVLPDTSGSLNQAGVLVTIQIPSTGAPAVGTNMGLSMSAVITKV